LMLYLMYNKTSNEGVEQYAEYQACI